MQPLRHADLYGAIELIGECEAAPDLLSFGDAVLRIADLVPGAVAFNEVDLARRTATAVRDPSLAAAGAPVAEFARLAHQNPLIVHGRQGQPPLAISDMLSARSFRALEFYDVVFAPSGFEDQIAVHLRAPTHRIAGIAINRDRRGFSRRDRALLELVAPHLSRAYLHVLERERADAWRSLLERGLGEAGSAAVLLGPDGEVDRIDARGEALLRSFCGPLAPGELPGKVRTWLRSAAASRRALLLEDTQGRRLSIRLLECDGPRPWRAIVLDEWGHGPSPDQLRALGLTAREAEVLAWVARGRSDGEIAGLLSISPRTVDKHLENLFRKLHVRNRAEAVAKAMSREPSPRSGRAASARG
jgi:DNA-binding CsgD family transcriptional regulator